MGVGTDARGLRGTREDDLGWKVVARVFFVRLGWEDVLQGDFLTKWEDSQYCWCSGIGKRQRGWGFGEWDTLKEG